MRGDDFMSAIGLGSPSSIRGVGSHAEFRSEHLRFARTQSRAMSVVTWESRAKPLHSWSEILLYAGFGVVVTLSLARLIT